MGTILIAGGMALALVLLIGYHALKREDVPKVAHAPEPRDGYARELEQLCEENHRLLASLQGDGGGGGSA